MTPSADDTHASAALCHPLSAKRASRTTSGILLVDKPQGCTSHDVVARTRKAAGTRKVGHAGTLDPMATGLLLLGLNSSTRLLTFMVGLDKEYFATIRLGQSTSTDDAEGDVVTSADASEVTTAAIVAGIARLTGPISQVPSSVSAIKVGGKRAYELARAGETVELKSRNVTISAFDTLEVRAAEAGPHGIRVIDVDVRVECSSGTYIRALARDLGADLGVGGHVTALRRTRIGPFVVTDAATLENLAPNEQLLSPAAAAAQLFAVYTATESEVTDLMHGKKLVTEHWGGAEHWGDAEHWGGAEHWVGAEHSGGVRHWGGPGRGVGTEPGVVSGAPVAVLAPEGRLVGLVEVTSRGARTIVNFPADEVVDGRPNENGDLE